MYKYILAAAGALALAAPAIAGNAPSRSVSYSDLDLSSEAGQAVLSERIEAAVHMVCGPVESSAWRGIARRNQCRRDALAIALADMDRAIARHAKGGERLAGRQ